LKTLEFPGSVFVDLTFQVDQKRDTIWTEEAERRVRTYPDGRLKSIPTEEFFEEERFLQTGETGSGGRRNTMNSKNSGLA
jgi:hypothetical protein